MAEVAAFIGPQGLGKEVVVQQHHTPEPDVHLPGLSTPRELYGKLQREASRLASDGVNADNVFNFVVTAHHLLEWLEKGPGGNIRELRRDVGKLKRHVHFVICKDITNNAKHYFPDEKSAVEAIFPSPPAFVGIMIVNRSFVGQLTPTMMIQVGQDYHNLDVVVADVMAKYEDLFTRYRI